MRKYTFINGIQVYPPPKEIIIDNGFSRIGLIKRKLTNREIKIIKNLNWILNSDKPLNKEETK